MRAVAIRHALGRLEAIERAMGLMAGYGLQLWPILQDMSQLNDLYGKRAGTFVANAGVQQVFGVNDYETAKWLSQMIGQETTGYQTDSYKPGDSPNFSNNLPLPSRMTSCAKPSIFSARFSPVSRIAWMPRPGPWTGWSRPQRKRGRRRLDLSRVCAAPLTTYRAAKENTDGITTDRGIPRRSSACGALPTKPIVSGSY